MSIERIRAALAAGPTPGPWCIYPETDGTEICAVDLVPGLPIRQVIAHPKHGANWIANARLIAACSPANVRELLDEMDRLRGLLCKCDMRTRLVGDGCEFCNPQLAEELAKEQR